MNSSTNSSITTSSLWGDSEHTVPTSGAAARHKYAASRRDDFSSKTSLDSYESFEYELGETTVPLKNAEEQPSVEDIPIPAPTFTSTNSLRNLTRQLAKDGKEGKLPLSPLSKKKYLTGLSALQDSPGARRGGSPSDGLDGNSWHPRTNRRTAPCPLSGGSLHGKPGMMKLPSGGLGGSNHGPRSRSPGPLGSLLGLPLSLKPLSSGSRESSPTSGPVGNGGTILGSYPSRSKSPGSHSRNRLGKGNVSPGPLGTRSKSPGSFQTGRRALRSQRRLSLKRGPVGPISILRIGRFSQGSQSKDAEASVHSTSTSGRFSLSRSDHGSPSSWGKSIPRRLRVRRVHFWFQDDPSVAPSYGTEDSMQFGDLGLDDSGEFAVDEEELGGKTMRGELSFIEVMGPDGEQPLSGEDNNCDCMVKRFNGSTIHEEFRASFPGDFDGDSSMKSVLTEDSNEGQSTIREKGSQIQLSEASFALPDFTESFSDSFKQSSPKEGLGLAESTDLRDSSRSIMQQTSTSSFGRLADNDYSPARRSSSFAPIPDLDSSPRLSISPLEMNRQSARRKLGTSHKPPRSSQPPPRTGNGSLASLLSEESTSQGQTEGSLPLMSHFTRQNSESSMDNNLLKKEAGSSSLKSKSESSTESSSESPTGVEQLSQVGVQGE